MTTEEVFISCVDGKFWVGTCDIHDEAINELCGKSFLSTEEVMKIATTRNDIVFMVWSARNALWEYLLDMEDTSSFGDRKPNFSNPFLQSVFYNNKPLQNEIDEIKSLPKKYQNHAYSELADDVAKYSPKSAPQEEIKMLIFFDSLYG